MAREKLVGDEMSAGSKYKQAGMYLLFFFIAIHVTWQDNLTKHTVPVHTVSVDSIPRESHHVVHHRRLERNSPLLKMANLAL